MIQGRILISVNFIANENICLKWQILVTVRKRCSVVQWTCGSLKVPDLAAAPQEFSLLQVVVVQSIVRRFLARCRYQKLRRDNVGRRISSSLDVKVVNQLVTMMSDNLQQKKANRRSIDLMERRLSVQDGAAQKVNIWLLNWARVVFC